MVLTAVSAILGVLPIAFGLGIEIFHHEVTIDAPSTQWWVQLSTSIAFGLAFATVLTLVFTPCALMMRHKAGIGWRKVKARISDKFGKGGTPHTADHGA